VDKYKNCAHLLSHSQILYTYMQKYVCTYVHIISISMRERSAGLKDGPGLPHLQYMFTILHVMDKCNKCINLCACDFYRPLPSLLEAHTRDCSSFLFWLKKRRLNDVIRQRMEIIAKMGEQNTLCEFPLSFLLSFSFSLMGVS
jgi:hypothetical protein